MKTASFRQQAGFACEECRKRKARCDRVRPQCGLCAEVGRPCVVIDQRPQRGPKKGQLDEMRTRIAVLEWQLGKQLGNHGDPVAVAHSDLDPKTAAPAGDSHKSTTPSVIAPEDLAANSSRLSRSTVAITPPLSITTPSTVPITPCLQTLPSTDAATTATTAATGFDDHPVWPDWQDVEMDGGIMLADMGNMLQFELEPPSPVQALTNRGFEASNLVFADLNQLYFDRVHALLPMVHRRRYFSWADQEKPSSPRASLRSAMHALAAAISAQYRSLGDALCQETRRSVESCYQTQISRGADAAGDEIPLELIQAWLLLAHYEFLCVGERQAMLTAGRAFRLVQLARLYDVDRETGDMPDGDAERSGSGEQACERFILAEEKRRTFWLAFSFDRFLCSRNEWPLTLQEETVRSRLPAPEVNFQNGQPVRVYFLSEALATNQGEPPTLPLSPFAECVVLAALRGRCMTHRRTSLVGSETKSDFWVRHDWLATVVDSRVNMLARSPSLKTVDRDPMLLFTHMIAHSTVIYLGNTLQKAHWQAGEQQLMAAAHQWRAERAAHEIERLARSVKLLGCFGVHLFIADPLACAADFFIQRAKSRDGRSSCGGGSDRDVENLLFVLRNLRDVNILARDYVCKLESDYNALRRER